MLFLCSFSCCQMRFVFFQGAIDLDISDRDHKLHSDGGLRLDFFIRIWFMFTNKKETERDFGGTKSQLKYRMWLTWQMKCIPLLFLVDFSFQTFVNGRLFIAFLVKHNEMLMGNWVSKGEVKDKRKMTKTTEKTSGILVKMCSILIGFCSKGLLRDFDFVSSRSRKLLYRLGWPLI